MSDHAYDPFCLTPEEREVLRRLGDTQQGWHAHVTGHREREAVEALIRKGLAQVDPCCFMLTEAGRGEHRARYGPSGVPDIA